MAAAEQQMLEKGWHTTLLTNTLLMISTKNARQDDTAPCNTEVLQAETVFKTSLSHSKRNILD